MTGSREASGTSRRSSWGIDLWLGWANNGENVSEPDEKFVNVGEVGEGNVDRGES